jgi:cellulose synthase/poly-beta-1,6-N-acetylglucosamine synthase-like glycosyltransferase
MPSTLFANSLSVVILYIFCYLLTMIIVRFLFFIKNFLKHYLTDIGQKYLSIFDQSFLSLYASIIVKPSNV